MNKRNGWSKRIKMVMLVAVLAFGAIPGLSMIGESKAFAADTTIVIGDGSQGNPYQIANADQLNDVRNHLDADKYFILTANIDLDVSPYNEDEGWVPIGDVDYHFLGNIDGNGYTITGLTSNRPSEAGLFGVIGNPSTISNLKLEDVSVISGNYYAGGLVGFNNGGTINSSYVTGSVSGTYNVGGLVGLNDLGTITNSYATASVDGSMNSGGLIGSNNGEISYSYATGRVESDYYAGGLVGRNDGVINEEFLGAEIKNSYATGDVVGYSDVGGLSGNNQGDIKNSYAAGAVNGGGYGAGGLVGSVNVSGTIDNSYATGNVIGKNQVGGLVGSMNGTTDNSYAIGNVNGVSQVGGLVGYNVGQISYSFATGIVNASVNSGGEYEGVGGLVGYGGNGEIKNSYATGNVFGNFRIGGLIGTNVGAIKNSYATGAVDGYTGSSSYYVGALVGVSVGGTISNTYATGRVNETNNNTMYVGGSIGSCTFNVIFNNNFYDKDTTGKTYTACGEGKSTSELKTLSTYTDLTDPSWDFDSEWYLLENYYPQLRFGIQTKTPTANPASGAVAWKTNVALSSPTVGAAVYYTLDGSTPTASSLLYSSPIVVSNDLTIKAIAVYPGKQDSEIMSSIYALIQTAAPTTGALTQGTSLGTTKLTGVDNGMEYSINGGEYNPITAASVDNLVVHAGDIISVRFEQTDTRPASLTQVLTVALGDIKSATAPSGNNGGGGPSTLSDGKLTLPAGQSGQVSLGDTVTVSIPAGATSKELKLSITKLLDTQNLLTNNQVLATNIYEILKNFPENFGKPVTLTFVFDLTNAKKDQRAAVFYYDEAKKVWVEVKGSKINGKNISVDVDHFTKYAVFAVDPAVVVPEPEQPKEPTDIDTKVKFGDIAGHWAKASIEQAVNSGIVKGFTDGTFKPNATVTRAEFAVMLMNALKPQGNGAELTFSDNAKIGAWAQKAIAQAVQAGIIKGNQDGSFRPNAEVTRAEMAAMIANALRQPIEANAATGFADDKDIPAWAKGSVAIVKQSGIIQGKSGNKFSPQDNATRAEAVTVLMKTLAQQSK